jgi:general secretion pathway protein D
MVRFAAGVAAAGLAVPLMAQQTPAPGQPTPVPGQAAPGVNQPATPADPAAPPAAKPPVIPRRVPAPAQSPGMKPPQSAPQGQEPGTAAPSQDVPGPGAAPAPAGPQRRFAPPPSGGMISLNFNRADLVEIIHIIAQQLRLTYTIDPEVKGSVTINSAEPLRAEDLLPVFHQVLRMNGAVAVRTGNLYHIMPIKDGKGLARPAGQSREDSFALQVIPVRFFAAAEMKRVLTPFLQPGGEIIENPRGNFLIVMDLPSNIQRLMEIADLIDVQVFAGTRMEIYQPKVASAEELAAEMTKVMQSFAASAPQAESFTAQFIALPRINQLLVISHSEGAWTYAKRWLDRIDIVAEGPGRRIFIYPVENGKAIELAEVLSLALGQPTTGHRDSTRTLQDLHRSTMGSSSGLTRRGPGGSPFGSSGSFGQPTQPLGAYAAVPVPGQVAPPVAPSQPGIPPVGSPPRPGAQTPQAQQQQQQQQQEQLRIVPDPATNSLIIYGTVQEFQNIKTILKELDAVPRQVLIDAVILQVDLKNTENFGVDYEILRRAGDVKIFDRTFDSRGAIISGALAAFAQGGGVRGVIGTGDTVRAFITALMTDSRVKLLSSPSVLAADNRPARIQVGAEVPIPTGSVTSTELTTTSTTIQYRNTGRILTIIPQVNAQGLVNLQIKAEVSALGDNIPIGREGETFPSFNTQDAETTAVVQDGETLVIGGLIGENKSKSRSGVPYLMDLPVVGRFFGTTLDNAERTELIMLITPRVIRGRDEARYVTEDFKSRVNAVRNELERIERDRASSPPRLAPPEIPPPVAPKTSEQRLPFAPSRTAPSKGASLAPDYNNVIVLSNRGVRPLAPGLNAGAVPRGAQPLAADPALLETTNSEPTIAFASPVSPAPTQPAYVLSVTRQSKPAAPAPEPKRDAAPKHRWSVQVASLADPKGAETIAAALRKDGYEAYVVTAQPAGAIWHRVRVGQFADLVTANRFKESMPMPQFKHAYVAVN